MNVRNYTVLFRESQQGRKPYTLTTGEKNLFPIIVDLRLAEFEDTELLHTEGQFTWYFLCQSILVYSLNTHTHTYLYIWAQGRGHLNTSGEHEAAQFPAAGAP